MICDVNIFGDSRTSTFDIITLKICIKCMIINIVNRCKKCRLLLNNCTKYIMEWPNGANIPQPQGYLMIMSWMYKILIRYCHCPNL